MGRPAKRKVPVHLKPACHELAALGFRVIHRDHIHTASVTATFTNRELVLLRDEGNFKASARERLGASMGHFLMTRGAMPIQEEIGDHHFATSWRAAVTVIIQDPEWDWPYPLIMEKSNAE